MAGRIHIAQLTIRVSHAMASSAADLRRFAGACAHEILRSIGATARGRTGVVHLDGVGAGPLPGVAPATAREAAERIASDVDRQLDARGRS